MSEMVDRVSYDDKNRLDEIVGTRGAHLERIGKKEWFLSISHADGSETALWFTSKSLPILIEERRVSAALSEVEG